MDDIRDNTKHKMKNVPSELMRYLMQHTRLDENNPDPIFRIPISEDVRCKSCEGEIQHGERFKFEPDGTVYCKRCR